MQGAGATSFRGWNISCLAVLAVLTAWAVVGLGFARGTSSLPPENTNWRVADAVTYESLSVFPVLSGESLDTSQFMTLDEALASGEAAVTEQGGEFLRRTRGGMPGTQPIPRIESGAQVNQLVLINRGSKPLLLLAGEVVAGGKQDRIIGKDRIVPVGAEPLPLDVFCVENGRWSTGSRFAAAQMMVHPSVREKAAVEQDQQQVWAAVRSGRAPDTAEGRSSGGAPASLSPRVLAELASAAAPTGSYVKLYGSPRVSGSVENFAAEVEKRFEKATANLKGEHVVGVVVAYGGEVAWSDIFASSQLFERYWPKLLRSYVVEALTRPELRERASLSDAREFVAKSSGHEQVESEPGVYRWIEHTQGHYAEIQLQALAPKTMTLHWLKVLRMN
jgi:hypothetical protein